MVRECGTCNRPRRKGLKGEGDGSPQRYVVVSSARACAVTVVHGHTAATVPGQAAKPLAPGTAQRSWYAPAGAGDGAASTISTCGLNSACGAGLRTRYLRP